MREKIKIWVCQADLHVDQLKSLIPVEISSPLDWPMLILLIIFFNIVYMECVMRISTTYKPVNKILFWEICLWTDAISLAKLVDLPIYYATQFQHFLEIPMSKYQCSIDMVYGLVNDSYSVFEYYRLICSWTQVLI